MSARPSPATATIGPITAQMTFPDFVRRQNRMMDSPEGKQALERLAARLSGVGAIPVMPISGFSGHSPVRYEAKDGFSRRLPLDVCQSLGTVARPLRMTALNLMHAALHHSLFTLSGSESVATTLSTANRELPELHQTTGWLASKAVLTSEPGSRPDADDFLAERRTGGRGALGRQHPPAPWRSQHGEPANAGQ